VLLLASCATAPATDPSLHVPSTASPSAGKADSSEPCPAASAATLNATLWVQTSAEHDALTMEIYGMARRQIDEAIANPTWSALDGPAPDPAKPPAIILDLDETAIDTSASAARLLKKGTTFSEEDWNTFALAGNARAIAPALDFLRYASSRGVAIFYITNRLAAQEPALRRNLAGLGFPVDDRDGDTVLTRRDRPEWSSSDKSPRRAFVGERYRVVMLFGDDLNDFAPAAGKPLAERNEIVRGHADWWGRRWFALPNPVYGSWERAVTGDAKTDCDQLRRKMDLLRTDETYVPGGTAPPMSSSAGSGARSDLSAAIAAAIAAAPKFEVLVAGARLDGASRDAAATIQKVIPLSEVPETNAVTLPAGYARLDRVEVTGDTATVALWYGPVPKPSAKKSEVVMNCGTGYTFQLRRDRNSGWTVVNRGVTMC
jgi:5'-nucleotidase (lipoprotein e(P4) family)